MNNFMSRVILMLWASISFVVLAYAAEPVNLVKNVQVRKEGERLLVKVEMRDPIKATPSHWSVVEPPRIVFDFPNAQNGSGAANQEIKTGDLKSLNLVQTDALTRLVLNLYRPTRYTSEVDGNLMFIRLEAASGTAVSAPSAFQPKPAVQPKQIANATATVRDVIFRRGDEGQAIILIDLTDGSIPVDVRRTATGLSIDLADVELPERLQNRRDVNDFATPVSNFVTKVQGGMARLDVAARGRWFHQAQMTNNQLAIEIKPIPADDANKLVQTGQPGQKVSINFFDADVTMILRTLADISGKNVMIDPSLAGRRVTVTLDNIPYDQALDIVMHQVNAAMRIRNDVIMFGDRVVLQQRDQAAADDAARANDNAPLAAESFELNFTKAADIANLLNNALGVADTQGNATPATGTAASGASGGAAAQPAKASKGLLSSRGVMTVDAATNRIFIRDTAQSIDAIRDIIRKVDIPARQVMIDARIVTADVSFGRALGVRLGYNDLSSTVAGNGVGGRIPGTQSYATVAGSTSDLLNLTGQAKGGGTALGAVGSATPMVNLGNSGAAAGQFAISIFNASLTKFINLELQASENEGKSTSISNPRVVTANNLEATISQGQKIPYTTASAQGTNTQFIDAKLSLTVKPQITPNGTVILELNVQNDSSTGQGNPPAINTTQLKTKVAVENGGTVVLGGVVKELSGDSEQKVPFFGDLPVVGNLFKSTSRSNSKVELLIFITPRVIDSLMSQSLNR